MRNALPLGLVLLSSLIPDAQATSMVRLSQAQLIDAADLVVRGTVTEVWTELEGELVWTHAQIEVQRVLKGDTTTELVILEQPGGAWADRGTTVSGAARFSVGEEAYFFVEHLTSDRWVPVGMFQGKFNVLMDPYARQEIVHRFAVTPAQSFDHRFIPLPPQDARVATTDFEASILARVQLGWDGAPIPGVSSDKLRSINRLQDGVR